MSSFLFLTFCVYVFRCLGLHFSEFILLGLSSGGFYLCRTNLHRGLTPGQQGLSEAWVVSFPYPASKTAQRATQGRVLFFPQNELTPPPKGGGAGYRLSWVGRVCPARSKLGHVGPTGPVRGFPGVVSLPRSLTGHKSPYRAELGFTAFSWCASFVEIPQAGTPGGNSLPREWGGSCKAASRFSQSRPMSTPLSARFR